jgi:hypothetical protein
MQRLNLSLMLHSLLPMVVGLVLLLLMTYIPEEHYLITAPAADLNATQYFKLFEKFMLCVGM